MKQTFVAVLGLSVLLSACQYKTVHAPSLSARDAEYMALVPNFETQITHLPYEINDPTGEEPGTIIVDTTEKFLYFVLPNKKAIRYGVATGDDRPLGLVRLYPDAQYRRDRPLQPRRGRREGHRPLARRARFIVIASEAKQSRGGSTLRLPGLLRRFAPRNDGIGLQPSSITTISGGAPSRIGILLLTPSPAVTIRLRPFSTMWP
jgi:hypothetical protein